MTDMRENRMAGQCLDGDPAPLVKGGVLGTVFVVVFALLPSSIVHSQAIPSFEVASVKPVPLVGQEGLGRAGMSLAGNKVTIFLNLKMLIMEAYEMERYQVIGGPDWADSRSEFFEIQAQSNSEMTKPEAHLMLRELLRERFRLEIHREMRETPIYALVVGKNGPKLKTSRGGERLGVMGDGKGWTGTSVPMAQLVIQLRGPAGRPVIDRTGLQESYDFRLDWSPVRPQSTETDGPSIFTAIEEQLGLKLEPQKAPMEFLIIDNAQRPTGN